MAVRGSGNKTVATAGIPERLLDQPYGIVRLDITALNGNGGLVYVGDRNVSSANGHELAVTSSIPDTITLTDDPYNVWLDVATNGEGVKWLAYDV